MEGYIFMQIETKKDIESAYKDEIFKQGKNILGKKWTSRDHFKSSEKNFKDHSQSSEMNFKERPQSSRRE